jgi:hypothetical protein
VNGLHHPLTNGKKERRMTTFAKASALLVLVPFVASCGGTGQEATTPEQKISRASERLRGSWLLVEFRPEDQLEPVLASLLAVQIGRLTVFLDGTNLTAQGVGVQANRQYSLITATTDQFTANIVDPQGMKYGVSGAFLGQDVVFTSQTPPWRGSGRLQRAE